MTSLALEADEGVPADWKTDWLYPVLAGIQVLALLASLYLLQRLVADWLDQPLKAVVVEGRLAQLDPEQLRRQVLAVDSRHFARLPLADIQQRLRDNAWVEELHLVRRWPQTLAVVVAEKRPVARWGNDGLISERGQVFYPESRAAFARLPLLQGPEARAEEVMATYRDFASLLRPLGLRLSGLQLQARGAWRLTLARGIEVKLGRTQLLERLQRFRVIYAARLKEYDARISQLDVRYPNGLAVVWKEPPTAINDLE